MPPSLPPYPAGKHLATFLLVSVILLTPAFLALSFLFHQPSSLSQSLLLSDVSMKTVPDKNCDLGQEVEPLLRKWWPREGTGFAQGHMARGLLALNLHKRMKTITEPSCTSAN